MPPSAWVSDGLCTQVGYGPWQPDEGSKSRVDRTRVAAAKALCRRCPVLSECAEWAITTGEEYGIWGAMTARERKIARMERRAA